MHVVLLSDAKSWKKGGDGKGKTGVSFTFGDRKAKEAVCYLEADKGVEEDRACVALLKKGVEVRFFNGIILENGNA